MKKILIFVAVIIIIIFVGYFFYKEGSLPANKNDDEPVIFVIEKGENLDSIINNLSNADLIRNRVVFYYIVKQMGLETKIQAGDFRLNKSMTAKEIAEELTHGTIDVWVTVPEGLRKEEVAEIMSEKFGIKETEFNEIAKEGYLFPDTYLVPKNPTAEQIVQIMENTLDAKIDGEIIETAKEKGLDKDELLTLASIVEKEAFKNDKQEIADILYKRLEENYPLQVDATVQYALGYQPSEKRWWKKQLTFDDLKIESPYNTYENFGLPPKPIANPGLESIKAAANASADTPYMFYAHDENGKTYYSKDYDEHLENVNKYLR